MNFNDIKQKELSVIYITSRSCNVCKSIFPKINKLVRTFKKCDFIRLETENYPEIAGEFMIFTVPGLFIYSKGKELYKAARFIDLFEVETILTKYYNILF